MTKVRLLGLGLILPLALLVILGALVPGAASGGDDDDVVKLRATLRGFEEVPAVSSGASGRFSGQISRDGNSITFTLSFDGLEGTVRQAHIHLGQRAVNGGIVVFLCQTATNPDPTGFADTCPQFGTVGPKTLTAANVIGSPGTPGPPATPPTGAFAQGIAATQFAELVRAIRAGVTYANVHSAGAGGAAANFNGGEIRGQIKAHDDD